MVKNPLNIKVLREIKNNFKTYLSVILIATLAVTLFTGIYANYKNFDERLDHIYQEANMCDGIIMTSSHNENIKTYLEKANIYFEERIYLSASYQNTNVYLASFKDSATLNLPYSHSLNQELNDSMVLVEENFLTRTNAKIGDTIAFYLSELNLEIPLKIDGTLKHPEALENSTYTPSFIYVGYNAVREALLEKFPNYEFFIDNAIHNMTNQFLVQADDSFFEEVKDKFMEDSTFIYSLKRSDLPSNMTVDADVQQAKMLIYIFPVIFYLVAVLIILTSISQLIQREQKNIGILKALGFSKFEILLHYMKIFLVLSLIGSLLGIILGPLIVPNVMGNKYNILYQLPYISLPFFRVEYLISVGILLAISMLTSFLACYEAMRQVPASALRGDNAFQMKLSFLNHFGFVKKLPLSILMAVRNMKRKISRTFMVIIGVLGCSALLACGFGIEDTLNYGIDLELEELIPYDVTVTYSTHTTKKEEIAKIESVLAIDEYAKLSVHLEAGHLISSYLYLLPEESVVFQPTYDEESCILSSRVAEEIHAEVGQKIYVVNQNKRYELKVTAIEDFCISQGIFIRKDRIEDIEFSPTAAWVKTTNEQENERVSESIFELAGIASSMSMAGMREHAEEVISSIKVMTWTIKIFAILLAVVVLYNLALLNFKERIKDIATLKVLGFSRFEVASSFIIEIITLTFIGSLLGLLFGYPLLVAVLSINENPLISYIYHIYPISYVITVLVTCGSSLLINLFFSFLTHKVEMVESLKSVE